VHSTPSSNKLTHKRGFLLWGLSIFITTIMHYSPLRTKSSPELFEQLYARSKQLLSWTRKKIEIIEAYIFRDKENQNLPYVSAGEIYYAHLGVNIGSEMDKERPVLIFQTDDQFVRQSNMVVIIPITSNTSVRPYRVLVSPSDIEDNHDITESSILVQQIRSISKARLSQLKGKLSKAKLDQVALEVNKLLYKSTPLQLEGDAQAAIYGAAKS
jgi:mRNA interferase MazF